MAEYIDYDATFSDHTGLAFYFLKIIFFTMAPKLINLCYVEREMNRGRPQGLRPMTDENIRKAIRELYQCLPFDVKLKSVDRCHFTWKVTAAKHSVSPRRIWNDDQ